MSLVDFMQQLQDQDNIVYSETPEPSIRVIPPEKSCTRIIPPESNVMKQPTVIKLKINQKDIGINSTNELVTNQAINNETEPLSSNENKVIQESVSYNVNTHHQIDITTQKSDEEIFISTGTELSKKSLWMDYYEKAKRSRKSNPVADRMKLGRFTITPDNKVLLLPDYDIVGKDPDEVLKDKWF